MKNDKWKMINGKWQILASVCPRNLSFSIYHLSMLWSETFLCRAWLSRESPCLRGFFFTGAPSIQVQEFVIEGFDFELQIQFIQEAGPMPREVIMNAQGPLLERLVWVTGVQEKI